MYTKTKFSSTKLVVKNSGLLSDERANELYVIARKKWNAYDCINQFKAIL